jgi:hypothetical protein
MKTDGSLRFLEITGPPERTVCSFMKTLGSSRFLEITGIDGSLDSEKIRRFLHILEYSRNRTGGSLGIQRTGQPWSRL